MKTKILTLLLLFASLLAFGQGTDSDIDKGTGILYYSGVPGVTPDTTYGAEIAMNKLTREMWVYNRDSTAWKKLDAYSQSYSDPSGDPSPGPYIHINRTDGGLFQWTGAAWVEISASTDDQTLSKPTTDSITIESGNTIVDRSLMQELSVGNVDITADSSYLDIYDLNYFRLRSANSREYGDFLVNLADNAFSGLLFSSSNVSESRSIDFQLNESTPKLEIDYGTNETGFFPFASSINAPGRLYRSDSGAGEYRRAGLRWSHHGAGLMLYPQGSVNSLDTIYSASLGIMPNFTASIGDTTVTNKFFAVNKQLYSNSYTYDFLKIDMSDTTQNAVSLYDGLYSLENSAPPYDSSLMGFNTSGVPMWIDWEDRGSGSGGSGDVTGPGSSTDNAIARWSGVSGDTLQNSAVVVTDGGDIVLNNRHIIYDNILAGFNPGTDYVVFNTGVDATVGSTMYGYAILRATNNTSTQLSRKGGDIRVNFRMQTGDVIDNGVISFDGNMNGSALSGSVGVDPSGNFVIVIDPNVINGMNIFNILEVSFNNSVTYNENPSISSVSATTGYSLNSCRTVNESLVPGFQAGLQSFNGNVVGGALSNENGGGTTNSVSFHLIPSGGPNAFGQSLTNGVKLVALKDPNITGNSLSIELPTADDGSTPTEYFRFEGGGNFGVNNTNPAYPIDVTGAIAATGIIYAEAGEVALDATGAYKIKTGSGSPESVVSASPGSTYHDTTNGILYTKNTGTGSTGWLPTTTGPSSSTDNAIVRFNGTGGTALQSSAASVDDNGELTVAGAIIDAETASTTGSASLISLYRSSTGDMTSSFGINVPFYIGDNTVTNQQIAYINVTRDGADDSGQFSIATYGSGFPQTALRLDSDQNAEFLAYDHNLKSGAAVSSDFAVPMLNSSGTMYRFEVSNIIARMAGGSASITAGTDESIGGDVAPSTATEISGTTDWAISNDSLVYTGTETRFFSIIATVDGDGSLAGDYSFSIAKNGTVQTASTITGTVLNANDKIDVMLLYGISLTTNDVIQIFVDVDSGSPTFTNENTIIKIEPFDN